MFINIRTDGTDAPVIDPGSGGALVVSSAGKVSVGSGGNKVTVATADASGSGASTGDLWINKSTNSMWFWTGAAWQQIIAP